MLNKVGQEIGQAIGPKCCRDGPSEEATAGSSLVGSSGAKLRS